MTYTKEFFKVIAFALLVFFWVGADIMFWKWTDIGAPWNLMASICTLILPPILALAIWADCDPSRRNRRMTLADRVEQASGPDRELDGDIWRAFSPPRYIEALAPAKRDGRGAEFERFMEVNCAPRFTTSLDAVASLLPKGYAISGGNLNENDRAWACVTACHGDYLEFLAEAATEPLARLAAIIRAHEKEGADND